MDNPCITLVETSKALHLRLDTLMAWLQRGDCPFGSYVKKPGKTHGHYIIIRARFEAYISGQDMKSVAAKVADPIYSQIYSQGRNTV
jgi:hypothetical protein